MEDNKNEFFGDLIINSIFLQEEKKVKVTVSELKKHLEDLKEEDDTDSIEVDNKKAVILYFLSKEDESYIPKFKDDIISKIRNSDKIEDSDNLTRIYNIAHFFKDFASKVQPKISSYDFFKNYLTMFSNIDKNYDRYILFTIYSGVIDYLDKNYKKAHKNLKTALNMVCDKQEKFKDYPFLVTYRKKAAEVLKKVYQNTSKDEKQKMQKSAIENFGVNGYYSLPILESMLEERKENNKKTPENVEADLVLATRMGYIGFLLNEQDVIERSINEIKNSLKITESWQENFNKNTNEKKFDEIEVSDDEKHKLSLHYAYNFILAIINFNSKNSQINKIAEEFRRNFLPYLDNIKSSEIVSNENQYDFVLDISNILSEDIDCRNFIKKISSEEIIKEFEGDEIENDKILTYIFTIHSEINKLSEEYFLETNANTKGELEKSIIKYAKTVLEFISRQDRKQPVINKPAVLSAIIEIYSAIIHIYFRKNDKASMSEYMKLFETIRGTFFIDQRSVSYGLLFKIEGDFLYLSKDYNEAEKKYQEAIDNGYCAPMVYFNLGFMQYLRQDNVKALENLKTCKKILGEIDLRKYPNNSEGRKKMMKDNYIMVKKIIKAIESN